MKPYYTIKMFSSIHSFRKKYCFLVTLHHFDFEDVWFFESNSESALDLFLQRSEEDFADFVINNPFSIHYHKPIF